MKKLLILFGFIFLCGLNLNCHSNEIKPKVEVPSRILNKDLYEIMPVIENIRKKNILRTENSMPALYTQILTTKNFVYISHSAMDCNNQPFYGFSESIDSINFNFMVYSVSEQPERYFNLNDLKPTDRKLEDYSICDDFYPVWAKFRRVNNQLKLERISSFYDNTIETDFYSSEDTEFLYRNEILIREPEPESRP